ncbi:MAG: hypothetical protein Q3966_07070, partial [Neisseria sp.]|nr:hypothetical protein [Neisseria sp.]
GVHHTEGNNQGGNMAFVHIRFLQGFASGGLRDGAECKRGKQGFHFHQNFLNGCNSALQGGRIRVCLGRATHRAAPYVRLCVLKP